MIGRLQAVIRSRHVWRDVGMAVFLVTGATSISLVLFATFGTARIGILFLTAVMMAGATRGLRSSGVAVLLATISYNYFLAGRGAQFQLPTDEELHNLVLFSIAAFFSGVLTGRLRLSERRAIRQLAVVDTLLEVERAAEDATDEAILLERITSVVAEGPPALKLTIAPATAEAAPSDGDPVGGRTNPVVVDGETVAVLVWNPASAEFEEFIVLLTDRVESYLARMQASRIADRLQLERGRNLLLASVSHDFRTPLATIIAATSSLIDLDGDADRKTRLRLLTAARSEAERLDRFVNQLLEAMRRTPDGVMTPVQGPLDATDRLRTLAERFNGPAGWPQVKVSGKESLIRADDLLFAQAFSNIIENAVKHSPVDAAVNVNVQEAGNKVMITIEDEGPGVPEADLAGIFDRYFQAAPRKKRSGYGIGLAVARFNVNAMGGEIRAANRPPGGLQVVVEFVGVDDNDGC